MHEVQTQWCEIWIMKYSQQVKSSLPHHPMVNCQRKCDKTWKKLLILTAVIIGNKHAKCLQLLSPCQTLTLAISRGATTLKHWSNVRDFARWRSMSLVLVWGPQPADNKLGLNRVSIIAHFAVVSLFKFVQIKFQWHSELILHWSSVHPE